jgi:hypothetical protein
MSFAVRDWHISSSVLLSSVGIVSVKRKKEKKKCPFLNFPHHIRFFKIYAQDYTVYMLAKNLFQNPILFSNDREIGRHFTVVCERVKKPKISGPFLLMDTLTFFICGCIDCIVRTARVYDKMLSWLHTLVLKISDKKVV